MSVIYEQALARAQGLTARDPQQALALFRELIECDPDRPEAHYFSSMAYMAIGDLRRAEDGLRVALTIAPESAAAAHDLGAVLLRGSDRSTEALLWLRRAVELAPAMGIFHYTLGAGLMYLGDLDGARTRFEQALALDKTQYEALFRLARMTRMDEETPLVASLWEQLRLVEGDPAIPSLVRSKAAKALGKALEDKGAFREAFESFARGAEWARLAHQYDIEADEQAFSAIETRFDAQIMRRLAGAGHESDRPIFIVGMPRCGSTLVETILSAHPMVHTGGELPVLPDLLRLSHGAQGEPYPDWATALNAEDCELLGRTYLERAPCGVAGKRRTTDKQLLNIAHVGLINLMLPNAKIIHVRRDPRDIAISCFTSGFNNIRELGYVSDLSHLGRYYRAYDQLMAHWRRVLPDGVMLEAPYEALVEDIETWARRMVSHCGLGWRSQCLDFHTAKRMTQTASVTQVREPIHRRSVGRWRSYVGDLTPFLQALGPTRPDLAGV